MRNLLDGGFYAIKKIELNRKNRQLNKKIVREVKLLSRLNHENVVRYYNSWIETTVTKADDLNSTFGNTELRKSGPKLVRPSSDEVIVILNFQKSYLLKKKNHRLPKFLVSDDNIEELAPPPINIEVSIIYDSKSQGFYHPSATSSDDSSDEDDEQPWGGV